MRSIFELYIETLNGRQNCNNDGGGGGAAVLWKNVEDEVVPVKAMKAYGGHRCGSTHS